MLDALFWWTGMIVWIVILFGALSTIIIDAHDRSILNRHQSNERAGAR